MSKTCTVVVRDEAYCYIQGLRPQDHQFLFEHFAIYVEGHRFMPLFKLGRWNGKVNLFDAKTGKLLVRLLGEACQFLDAWGYDVKIDDQRRPVPVVKTRVTQEWFLNRGLELDVTLRPYQVEAINLAIAAQSGILEMATGAGKTLTVAALCDALNKDSGLRTIVVVPSSDLVDQTITSFHLVGLDVGCYSGSTKDIEHDHVIATWQALQNNPQLLKQFDAIIIDECHGAAAKVIGELLNDHASHCAYRYGCTGTIPKPKLDAYTIRGSLGDVLYTITAADLIRMGYLADLEIEPIEIQDNVEDDFPDFAAERAYINRGSDRLDLIADLVVAKAQQHGNTLVLVNSIKQGKALQALINDSVFLHGETENDVRAEWYRVFAERDDLIVIATYGIASTGISIDRIFAEVMVDAGKSFIRCIQSIGRGLRKAGDKDKVHVVDIHSKLKWSRKHFNARKKHYIDAGYPVLPKVKVKP